MNNNNNNNNNNVNNNTDNKYPCCCIPAADRCVEWPGDDNSLVGPAGLPGSVLGPHLGHIPAAYMAR